MRNTVLALLAALAAASCNRSAQAPVQLTAMEAQGLLRNDFAFLVDTREPQDRRNGVIPGAIALPMSAIQGRPDEAARLLRSYSRDKQLVVLARNADEARIAATRLAAEGRKTGYIESIDAWKKAGLPTEPRGVSPSRDAD